MSETENFSEKENVSGSRNFRKIKRERERGQFKPALLDGFSFSLKNKKPLGKIFYFFFHLQIAGRESERKKIHLFIDEVIVIYKCKTIVSDPL